MAARRARAAVCSGSAQPPPAKTEADTRNAQQVRRYGERHPLPALSLSLAFIHCLQDGDDQTDHLPSNLVRQPLKAANSPPAASPALLVFVISIAESNNQTNTFLRIPNQPKHTSCPNRKQLDARPARSATMCLIFTCGEHTFHKEVEGYEGIVCRCDNCGNYSGHVVKQNPWFTFCFIVSSCRSFGVGRALTQAPAGHPALDKGLHGHFVPHLQLSATARTPTRRAEDEGRRGRGRGRRAITAARGASSARSTAGRRVAGGAAWSAAADAIRIRRRWSGCVGSGGVLRLTGDLARKAGGGM